MKNKFIPFFAVLILLVLAPLVLAHTTEVLHEENLTIPSNIQKLIDYENEQAQFYLKNLSFLVAFLAGIIGLLTPCSLAILPAFFAYSFKEKKELTKMTLAFFFGFMPVFVTFGLIATFLGKSMAMFQQSNTILVNIAGGALIIFGLMALFGKGFSGIHINKKVNKTTSGIFLFGILFGIGFTACVGPILIGILLIAGVLQNYVYSGFLMFFYSLGLFVPLFILTFFSDKYNFAKKINNINKKVGFSITNIISGGLLIILGVLFIFYGGTFFLDRLGLGGFTIFIYSIQNKLISLPYVNIIGGLILIGFVYLLWRVLKGGKK